MPARRRPARRPVANTSSALARSLAGAPAAGVLMVTVTAGFFAVFLVAIVINLSGSCSLRRGRSPKGRTRCLASRGVSYRPGFDLPPGSQNTPGGGEELL